MRSYPRVLIAGGGIGGLTAALALSRMGCEVEVYEQAGELREVGAGLQLAANGTRVLYALGVGEALEALSCEAESKEIRIWNSARPGSSSTSARSRSSATAIPISPCTAPTSWAC